MTTQYISYFRVSTVRQGQSGLGLEAQRAATETFLRTTNAVATAEFTEVESGKRTNRPQLTEAIKSCRDTGATLLIAKLDRLARNVHFISGLLESGVKFTAIDMPNADRFMLHVYAAMAEEEGRRISERTKAALAAAKARGVRLGVHGSLLATQHKQAALRRAQDVEGLLKGLILLEGLTFQKAAMRLNSLRVPTANGKGWHATTVHRAWKRIRSYVAEDGMGGSAIV